MLSPCSDAERAQLDFFGPPPVPAAARAEAGGPVSEEPAAPPTRTAPSAREAQLSLGLAAQALNQFEWTDQQIDAFRDGVLVAQLHLLNDERTTPQLRAELITWIAAPKRNPVELKHAPLSFQACCLSAGVDFEEMRERTLYVVAPGLIDQLD